MFIFLHLIKMIFQTSATFNLKKLHSMLHSHNHMFPCSSTRPLQIKVHIHRFLNLEFWYALGNNCWDPQKSMKMLLSALPLCFTFFQYNDNRQCKFIFVKLKYYRQQSFYKILLWNSSRIICLLIVEEHKTR